VSLRHAEDRQRSVPEQLVDAPFILEQGVHHRFEHVVDELGRVFGVHRPDHLQGAAHVREEDRDQTVLALIRSPELTAEGGGKRLLEGGEFRREAERVQGHQGGRGRDTLIATHRARIRPG